MLEFGPIIGFVITYLILRHETYWISETAYSGFLVVTAAFIPVFLGATYALWYLTRRVARIQVATAVMVVIFGGLGVWLNDDRLLMIKPTAIYLTLALVLCIGLLRGQSWLEFIMEDMIPLRPKGWMLLTRRVTVLFFASAGANELVWRTQSESFWVLFETLFMPLVILVFFLAQIGLYVEYATLSPSRRKR